MKRFNILMVLGLFIVTVIASCTKPTDPVTNNTPNKTTDTNFYFTAKVDGTDWKADMSSSTTYANAPHSGMLTISASVTPVTSGVFLINVSGYTGAATYSLGGNGNNSYGRYTTGSVGAGTYSAWKAESPGSTTTGTITITKDDAGVIEGTIVFDGYSEEAKNTKKITEGKFRMKKQ